MTRRRSFSSVSSLAVVLAILGGGCAAGDGGGASSFPPASSESTAPPVASGAPPSAAGTSVEPPAPSATLADDPWRTTELRDVRTGEAFSINDLKGRLVVLEPMAVWCINCRIQQNEARTALANLGADDIVYVSLDVDPNETDADLARYADELDYPWHFVVASRDVARSLAQSFGDQVLSPPSTPHIVITPDGGTELSFGFKSAADLEAQLAALLR